MCYRVYCNVHRVNCTVHIVYCTVHIIYCTITELRGDFRGLARTPSQPPDHLKGFQPLLDLGRCGESNLRIKDKIRTGKSKKVYFMYCFLKCV